ncbi:MAG: hypothetical protein ACJ8GN_15585 [Longimicrobiaceae bacterium]
MIGASHHRRILRAFAAALLAACASGPLAAQERRVARVGDQVRVTSGAIPGTVRGELVLVANDSLYVRPDWFRTVGVPLAEVEWIEVRHRRSWLNGVMVGVAIGAPVGAAGGYLLGVLDDSGPNGCYDGCGLLPAIGALGGLMTGTVVGAVVGGVAPGGRWMPAARPDGGGVALSLGIKL